MTTSQPSNDGLPPLKPLITTPPTVEVLMELRRVLAPADLSSFRAAFPVGGEPFSETAMANEIAWSKQVGPSTAEWNQMAYNAVPSGHAQMLSSGAAGSLHSCKRSTPSPFRNLLFAASVALFSDARHVNVFVDTIRERFLRDEHTQRTKKKIPVERLLSSISKLHTAPEVDVLVLSHNRTKVALYCHPKGAINISEFPSRRALAALEVVETSSGPQWFALSLTHVLQDHDSNNNTQHPVATAPSDAVLSDTASTVTAAGNRGMESRPPKLDLPNFSGGPGMKMLNLVSAVQASALPPHAAGDAPQLLVSTRQRPPLVAFSDAVQNGDRRFNNTVRTVSGPPQAPELPFYELRYPNVVQGNVGFGTLVSQGLHRLFWKSALRFVVGLLLSLVIVGVAIAMMIQLVESDDLAFCCAEHGATNKKFTCWDQNSSSFANASAAGDVESRYIDRLCLSTGDILANARTGFLFGGLFSIGRLLIMSVCGAFVSLLWVCFTHFQTVRVTALEGARPVFVRVLVVLHVLVAAAVAAASAWVFYVILFAPARAGECDCVDWFDVTDQAACAALTSGASTRLYAYFHNFTVSAPHIEGILVIVLLIAASLQFLVALLWPLPSDVSEEARKGTANRVIPFAIPDTSIYQKGPYAPDGILPEQEEELCQLIYQTLQQDAWRKGKADVVVSRDDIQALVSKSNNIPEHVRQRFQTARRAIKFMNALAKPTSPEPDSGLKMEYAMQYTGDKFVRPEDQLIVEYGALAYLDAYDKAHPRAQHTEDALEEVADRLATELSHPQGSSNLLRPKEGGIQAKDVRTALLEHQLRLVCGVADEREAFLDRIVLRLQHQRGVFVQLDSVPMEQRAPNAGGTGESGGIAPWVEEEQGGGNGAAGPLVTGGDVPNMSLSERVEGIDEM